jgi:hypothetical protein
MTDHLTREKKEKIAVEVLVNKRSPYAVAREMGISDTTAYRYARQDYLPITLRNEEYEAIDKSSREHRRELALRHRDESQGACGPALAEVSSNRTVGDRGSSGRLRGTDFPLTRARWGQATRAPIFVFILRLSPSVRRHAANPWIVASSYSTMFNGCKCLLVFMLFSPLSTTNHLRLREKNRADDE